jgi:hypothetical protein
MSFFYFLHIGIHLTADRILQQFLAIYLLRLTLFPSSLLLSMLRVPHFEKDPASLIHFTYNSNRGARGSVFS